jgi:hypothetical protein
MRPRNFAHFLLTGIIVAGLLVSAEGIGYAATPRLSSTPTPTFFPASSSEEIPISAWIARELDPIVVEGGWSGIIRVWVRGQIGLPVTIRTADGGWSTVNFVGAKPEYGPDALEFAPVWPGRYVIEPEGLGVSFALELAAGRIGQVLFEPGAPSGSLPTPTPEPTRLPPVPPSPTPRPTRLPAVPPSPTPVPATQPPSAPVALAAAPTLVDPPDGTAVSVKARLDLAWSWPGSLGPDDYFQVEVWNSFNGFDTPIDVAWVKVLTYKYDSNPNPNFGPEYRWRISVIRGIPAREKDWSTAENRVWEPNSRSVPISAASDTWKLIIDPGCPPGDRSC